MEHYVTLFDSLFLPQGLALYMSMEQHVHEYTLWVLCVDDEAHELLSKLRLPNMRLLKLSRLETDELLNIKPTRSKGEYCWTLTPFAPHFVFEADPEIKRVTYLDADMAFYGNPDVIFREFDESGKSVLITEHAYAPKEDASVLSGKYCVQFIIFARDGGNIVRKWWADRCIDWCYARFEDGKFGDQKYLEEWPRKYNGLVHVSKNKEYFQAPWNCKKYAYSDAVLFHFHGLRLVQPLIGSDLRVCYGGKFLPKKTIQNIYKPYCELLQEAINKLRGVHNCYYPKSQSKVNWTRPLKNIIRYVQDSAYSLAHLYYNDSIK